MANMDVYDHAIALLDAFEKEPLVTPKQRESIGRDLQKAITQQEETAHLLRELSRAYGLLVGDVWMHDANPTKNNMTGLKLVQS